MSLFHQYSPSCAVLGCRSIPCVFNVKSMYFIYSLLLFSVSYLPRKMPDLWLCIQTVQHVDIYDILAKILSHFLKPIVHS